MPGLKVGRRRTTTRCAPGLELTLKQLLKVAGDNGLTVVDPLGQPFDPDQHQAISQSEAGAGVAPGTVTQVFQKGYLLNSRLLRPPWWWSRATRTETPARAP
jgi:molecular chaperone GrpE (heat shock protein)